MLQVSDFDFVEKSSLQADAIASHVDDTYIDDEDRRLAIQTDHEYGSGYFPPDSSGTVYNFTA